MEKQELIKQIVEALKASGFEGTIIVSDDATGDTTVSATPQETIKEEIEPTEFDLSSVLASLFGAAQAAAHAAPNAQIQGQALLKAQLEEELNELRGIDEVVSRDILEREKIVADNQMMLSILARDKEAYYARANEIIEQLAYL